MRRSGDRSAQSASAALPPPGAWHGRFHSPGLKEAERLARATRAYITRIPRHDSTGQLQADLDEAWLRYILVYFDMLESQRFPADEHVREFEKVAKRRMYQSVELVDLQRAFRSGARVLLDYALDRVDRLDAGIVASMTMTFEDIMSTAAERAYLEEHQAVTSNKGDTVSSMILMVLRGEISADSPEVTFAAHDFDFTRTFTIVEFGAEAGIMHGSAPTPGLHRHLSAALRAVFPNALKLSPAADSFVVIVPGEAVTNVTHAISGVLTSSNDLLHIRAGVSMPRSGIGSVRVSYREAMRSRLLGQVFEPSVPVQTWSSLRRIDVFKGDESIDEFVRSTIGPLITHDRRKGTQLLATLAAFMEANGNRKRAAADCMVHINTLDYRLRQIRGLIGQDVFLRNTFRIHLALRLLPLLRTVSTAADERVDPAAASNDPSDTASELRRARKSDLRQDLGSTV